MRRLTIAGLLILCVACGRPASSSQDALRESQARVQARDVAGAISALEQALARDPDNTELRLAAARLYLASGNAAASEAYLKRLLSNGVPRAELLVDLGETFLAQQKFNEALELCPVSADLSPATRLELGLICVRADLALPNHDDARIVQAVLALARERASTTSTPGLARFDGELGELRQKFPQVRGGLEHFECAHNPPRVTSESTPQPDAGTARVLRVGPQRPLKSIAAAASAARDGDVVEIEAGDYSGDVASWPQDNLVLRGVNGRPHLRAGGRAAAGKAIWFITGDNVRVENIEFSGARNANHNGAGIRFEGGGHLLVTRSSFHDNENGILTGNEGTAGIRIEFSEFARNGRGDGFTHNIYIGRSASFVLYGSYSHEVRTGHLVKSRARRNQILYSRLSDEMNGNSSYNVDLPEGGEALVLGNVMQQSPETENQTMVSFAGERSAGADDHLYVVYNTLFNMRLDGIYIDNKSQAPALVANNVLTGAPGISLRGAGREFANIIGPRAALVDARTGNFSLRKDSEAIDAGEDLPAVPGLQLLPAFEYLDPARVQARPEIYRPDAGALEFCGW